MLKLRGMLACGRLVTERQMATTEPQRRAAGQGVFGVEGAPEQIGLLREFQRAVAVSLLQIQARQADEQIRTRRRHALFLHVGK